MRYGGSAERATVPSERRRCPDQTTTQVGWSRLDPRDQGRPEQMMSASDERHDLAVEALDTGDEVNGVRGLEEEREVRDTERGESPDLGGDRSG